MPRGAMVLHVDSGGMHFEASDESLWWHNTRGPHLSLPVEGDVVLETAVLVRRASDHSLPPDHEWQFGGIMLRNAASDGLLSLENYVFIVVGHRYQSLQIEYKSTRDGVSDVRAIDWQGGDAVLRITRSGPRFTVAAREPRESEWRVLDTFDRSDLPPTLQASLIAYAHSEGRRRFDLRATFTQVSIRQSISP